MVDPQRDIIDHRKRSKPLGEAAQFNGRQSHHSLCRAAVGLLIYRWINISTNEGPPERLRRLFVIAIQTCSRPWSGSRSLSSGAHSRDPLARNDDLRPFSVGPQALTLSPSHSIAASTPPLPCGISSALRPTSMTPRVPRIMGALTCPIWAIRNAWPESSPIPTPSTTPHFSLQ